MKKVISGLLMVGLFFSCSTDIPVSPAQQLIKDTAAIDKYLTANNVTAVQDPSGMRYVVHSLGAGALPTQISLLKVKYVGRLLTTQAIFDQSANPPAFFNTPLSNLIQGWQIAFQYLPKGSIATLYIPSGLAYGTQSPSSAIPANSNLIFDLELVDFK